MSHINWRNLALLLIADTCWLASTLGSDLPIFWSVDTSPGMAISPPPRILDHVLAGSAA